MASLQEEARFASATQEAVSCHEGASIEVIAPFVFMHLVPHFVIAWDASLWILAEGQSLVLDVWPANILLMDPFRTSGSISYSSEYVADIAVP